jgi:hypothetical protein
MDEKCDKALFFDPYRATGDPPSGPIRVPEPIFSQPEAPKALACELAVRAVERGKQAGEWKSCDPRAAKFI